MRFKILLLHSKVTDPLFYNEVEGEILHHQNHELYMVGYVQYKLNTLMSSSMLYSYTSELKRS